MNFIIIGQLNAAFHQIGCSIHRLKLIFRRLLNLRRWRNTALHFSPRNCRPTEENQQQKSRIHRKKRHMNKPDAIKQ